MFPSCRGMRVATCSTSCGLISSSWLIKHEFPWHILSNAELFAFCNHLKINSYKICILDYINKKTTTTKFFTKTNGLLLLNIYRSIYL